MNNTNNTAPGIPHQGRQRPAQNPAGEMPIPVFYSPAMLANSESFSPSAGKPALAVESWQFLGLPLELHTPQPLSAEQFGVAHDPDFVADVLSCRSANGFGNKSPAVAAALPWTSGAMLSAAREALNNGIGAIAPCSGFHHAGYDFAGGYCTFNGLMVTAAVLLAEGRVQKIGILDFDQHWGNGTEDIIERLQLGSEVVHYSPREYTRSARAEAFLSGIPKILERFAGCDVLLYQAGADPHIDDPLGGWLTTDQLYRRDRAVFDGLRRLGIPVAWNLAGGYQHDEEGGIRPVLDIHDNTLVAFVEAYGHASLPVEDSLRKEAA
jgi:acetoin utilization deacetylase AcuC-like enzyme